MSKRYSEHLDKEHPECPDCNSALGFHGDEFDEGQPDRCFTCAPKISEMTDEEFISTVALDKIKWLKDRAIDILIDLRMALAKQEGIEDWQNDSSNGDGVGIIESPVTSGDAQEMIWGLDQ